LRISPHQLDTFSSGRLQRVKSLGCPTQHLLGRVGENDLVATLSQPHRLMSRTAANIDDPSRRRGQMKVELPRSQLMPHKPAQQTVMIQERLREKPVRIWRRHGHPETSGSTRLGARAQALAPRLITDLPLSRFSRLGLRGPGAERLPAASRKWEAIWRQPG
jgi:hypothetical protein